MVSAEATIGAYSGSAKPDIGQDRNVPSGPRAYVDESVFKGYLQRALKEWVLAGKPHKR